MKGLAPTLLVICLVAALPAPGHASFGLPVLAGHNVVVGTGPSSLLVRLDQKASVDIGKSRGAGWFNSFETKASWAAPAIEEVSSHGYQERFGQLQVLTPECAEEFSCIGDTATWYRLRSKGGPTATMTLDEGIYRVYVLTDPGTKIEARFDIQGSSGHTRLHATTPVTANFVSKDETSFTGAAHVAGKISGRLEGRGLVVGGHWFKRSHSYSRDSVSCLQRGTGEDDPLNTCGIPPHTENGLATNAASHYIFRERGTWTYKYRMAIAGSYVDDGRMGAFALYLTSL